MVEGEKVVLRALEAADAEVVQRWLNNLGGTTALRGVPAALSRKATEAWVLKAGAGSDHTARVLAVETKDGRLIGLTQLSDIEWVHRRARLSFLVGEPDFVDRGFEADAIRTMTQFGFALLNLNRIEVRVPSRAENIIRAYKQAGYAEEGRLVQSLFVNGAYDDEVVLAALARPRVEN